MLAGEVVAVVHPSPVLLGQVASKVTSRAHVLTRDVAFVPGMHRCVRHGDPDIRFARLIRRHGTFDDHAQDRRVRSRKGGDGNLSTSIAVQTTGVQVLLRALSLLRALPDSCLPLAPLALTA